MKKSYIIASVLLVLLLTAALSVSVYAAGDTYDLYVAGVQVSAENANDVLADGTVSYDAATKTLTLNGANISECHSTEMAVSGIYSEIADLTVKLVGENKITLTLDGDMPDGSEMGIFSTKNLNVTGTGKLWSNTYTLVCTEQIVIEDCEISSEWYCASAVGDVSADGATLSGKVGLISTMSGDITLKNTSVPDGGNYIGMYTETGDITIENCNVTIHSIVGVDDSSLPIVIGEGGGTLTVKDSALDIKGALYGILSPVGAGVFENVSGSIEVMGDAAYGMLFGGTVSMKGCELELVCRATEDAACGICSMGNIIIEDSKLRIDTRTADESAICIGGIESPNTNAEVWNSTLELTASGPNAAGFYANNVKLNQSITRIEAAANPIGKGFAAGIAAAQGRALVNGGVLDVLATGPVEHEGPATVGILMGNAILAPEFIEADVKLRGNQAICASPDLSLYGREYELIASPEISGDAATEFNKENLDSIRYLHIHPYYTVSFDGNGLEGTMEAIDRVYGSLKLPENGFVLPEGVVFEGWALSADGEPIDTPETDVNKDLTLFAVWRELAAEDPDDEPGDEPGNTPGGTDEHTHKYGSYVSDGTSHWRACECGERLMLSAHVDTNENSSCDVCGTELSSDAKLGTGAIVAIVIGSAAIVCIGGFSLFWFVIKKKSFADLIAAFKK